MLSLKRVTIQHCSSSPRLAHKSDPPVYTFSVDSPQIDDPSIGLVDPSPCSLANIRTALGGYSQSLHKVPVML